MTQKELKEKKLRQLRGALRGIENYICKTESPTAWAYKQQDKLVKKIEEVEKFKTT